MHNLFDGADRDAMLARLAALDSVHPRQWGRMTLPQMLAHCSVAFQFPLGERTRTQSFLGKVVSPFVRRSVLGRAPLKKNGPTGPDFIITGEPDFEVERQRLMAYVVRFCAEGRGGVNNRGHVFFGPMTGEEWGRLMYNHLDHHLRQFGA